MADELPAKRSSDGFLTWLILVGVLAIGFALIIRGSLQPRAAMINQSFPTIKAAGWINGTAPTDKDFGGKVLVVDAWAEWCGPCRLAMPALLKLHERYKDRVIFIGLTTDGTDAQSLKATRDFIESEKIPWLNGYGAIETLEALQANEIPQLWVVDARNRILFHEIGYSTNMYEEIDHVLTTTLKETP